MFSIGLHCNLTSFNNVPPKRQWIATVHVLGQEIWSVYQELARIYSNSVCDRPGQICLGWLGLLPPTRQASEIKKFAQTTV